jgi:hypothetical protein
MCYRNAYSVLISHMHSTGHRPVSKKVGGSHFSILSAVIALHLRSLNADVCYNVQPINKWSLSRLGARVSTLGPEEAAVVGECNWRAIIEFRLQPDGDKPFLSGGY